MDRPNQNSKDKRTLLWVQHDSFQGWICSRCEWKSPLPTLLSDSEAKSAYDRLAEGKFRQHLCDDFQKVAVPGQGIFATKIRKLVAQGFKPKDAVEIMLQEVEMESRGDQQVLQQARVEGEDFLRRVRQGLL